jgi:RIO kinase 1
MHTTKLQTFSLTYFLLLYLKEEKLRERLFRYERESRFLRKDSDDRKIMEEVFDKATLLALYSLLNQGEIAQLNGVVSAGKEARVYWGVTQNDSARAVKIYLTTSAEFKKRLKYIAGDRRFRRIPKTSKEIVKVWVQKEFKNLQLAYSSGIRVPRPYNYKENILITEYIGEPPSPAPTFAEVEVDDGDYKWTVETISNLFKKAQLIHADFSEYNIFKFRGERVLFDMGSAIHVSHPEAREFLLRDTSNIVRFFKKRGIYGKTAEEIVEEVTS